MTQLSLENRFIPTTNEQIQAMNETIAQKTQLQSNIKKEVSTILQQLRRGDKTLRGLKNSQNETPAEAQAKAEIMELIALVEPKLTVKNFSSLPPEERNNIFDKTVFDFQRLNIIKLGAIDKFYARTSGKSSSILVDGIVGERTMRLIDEKMLTALYDLNSPINQPPDRPSLPPVNRIATRS